MHKNIVYILLLLFVSIMDASAQAHINESPVHGFNHLTTLNGFESNTIWTIHQDATGFMWFGTKDGIYKYDGIKLHLVKRFFWEDKSSVTAIAETRSNHTLWLIVDNKLFTLDLQTERIEKVKQAFNQHVLSIYTDHEDRLWVSDLMNGIYTLDVSNGKFEKKDSIYTLVDSPIVEIGQDAEKNYYFLQSNAGVSTYNKVTGERAHFVTHNLNSLTCLIDTQKRIWLGTWTGLYIWNHDSGKFEKIALGNYSKRPVLGVIKIMEKTPDELYIATDSGLFIYCISTGNITHYQADAFKNRHLNNNYINDIYIDNERTLWLATYFGGVNYISRNSRNFLTYEFVNREMDGHVVSFFTEDEAGNLWITTDDGGFSFYNKTTKEITNFNPFKSPHPYVDFFNVHTIETDKENLYIGMASVGLNIVDLKSKKVTKVTTEGPDGYRLNGMSILTMTKVSDNQIAIGTTQGLDFYDTKSGRIEHVNEIPADEISHIMTDRKGNIWVCGRNMGAYKRNKEGKWLNLCEKNADMANLKITRIAEYNDQIYLGTQYQGLICYNPENDSYEKILSEDLTSATVSCIIPKDDHLWVGTSNGLYLYSLKTKKKKHFTEVHGLKSKCIYSGILTKDGTIFIGSTNGLNGFKPDELDLDISSQRTVFTSLRVNNEEMTTQQENSMLQKIIAYTSDIELSHNQSNISIEFSQLSYTDWNERTYRYRLSPLDKEWITIENNVLNLKQMAPGNYTLSVQNKNNDGTWNEEGCILKISILPPWWATWQMYTLYILLLIGFIIYSIFLLKKKQERRIKEIHSKKQEEIYQSKMEFFTNVIHDIRTPLTLILSPLEELCLQKEAEPFQNVLKMMRRNGKRLLNNVNLLMDFQKMEKGKEYAESKEPIDIIKELTHMMEDFQNMAESRYIAINLLTETDSHQPCYVEGNKDLFDKTFTNLLSNALKFTTNCINIRITQDADAYTIAIEDNGIGISKELQERIFEPFFQIKKQLPQDYIGTGIGLYIVRNAVNKMGGTLSLSSEIGKGATFYVTLPAAQVDIQGVSDHELTNETPQVEGPDVVTANNENQSAWKIAVADDNEDMRHFIDSLLSPYYQVYTYPNGQELLEDTEKISFDLIVSDIMMPKLNGYELCKSIKDNTQSCHIPVILLTAKIMETDEIEGLDHGADAYIRKPFSKDLLLARIKNLIKNRENMTARFIHDPDVSIREVIQNEKDNEFIEKLNGIIEKNINNADLSAQTVASELCMCRALFFSKMKAVSGVSFTSYVRIVRLKKAIELMKSGKYSLLEISKEVGFSSLSYFSKSFKQQFNLSPSEYIKKK